MIEESTAQIPRTIASVLLIVACSFSVPETDVTTYGSRDDWARARILDPVAPRARVAPAEAGALRSGGWDGEGKGSGISVYVVDTGVDNLGIFQSLEPGYHAFGSNSNDCGEGHGTHVASIIAGTRYGVAESATIVPVRVLDCRGSGAKASVVKGLRWVIAKAQAATSVVNLSFGGKKDNEIDRLVTQLTERGIPVVIAAGNGARDTAQFSPTRTGCDKSLSIVVAASTEFDAPWTRSNYGECVSIHAPGVGVRAFGPNGEHTVTGTSFAAPYVAGAIAAYASECGVTTHEAWLLVLAQSSPVIDVGKKIDTTTRRLHLRSGGPSGPPCGRG